MMFPRQSSGQTPVLNRMGLDQLKALFDQSMQPGGDTQFDPYAVLSAIRSKTEEAKFAQAQRNMAAMQQNQAQGIGSLAQQIRREADMVQPPVNMARGGIVAFAKGKEVLSPEAIEKLRRDNMVTPEVQAERDQIAAQTRAQRLKTPEAARAKLEQLDRAVAQATESDSKGIFERERRLTTQALRILESQGPAAALRQGVEALLPAANAAVAPSPAIPRQGAATTGVYDGVPSTSLTSVEGFPINAPAREAGQTAKPNVETSQPSRGFFGTIADYFNTPSERRLPILDALISGQVSGSPHVPRTSRSVAPPAATSASSASSASPAPAPTLEYVESLGRKVDEAKAALEKAERQLSSLSLTDRNNAPPGLIDTYRNEIATARENYRTLLRQYQTVAEQTDIGRAAQVAPGVVTREPNVPTTPPMGASSTPPPAVTSASPFAPAASPAATAVPEAAVSATAGQADADATAGATATGQSPGGVSSQRTGTDVFTDIISRMAKVQEQQNANLQNRMSELRTRRGVPEEIAAGQAGIERIMAEQLANEQRINDQRMAEARKLYESRQTELTPSIARVLRGISSKPGALFESLGEGTEKEEQRVRTGKEEARKELTAAQRESDEAVRNMLKMRMLEAQRVQAIRENRQKDVDNIDDKIADLREKIDTQGMANLKTESEIRLHQLQYGKPTEIEAKVALAIQNPRLYDKLFPSANDKVTAFQVMKQMSENLISIMSKGTLLPDEQKVYAARLESLNSMMARLAGIDPTTSQVKRAVDPATGQQIISEDGGKTWKDVKTGKPFESK